MELIENLLQLLVTFVGVLLSGISYRESRRQANFLLLCFYGCFDGRRADARTFFSSYLPPPSFSAD